MTDSSSNQAPALCPRCNAVLTAANVRSSFWQGDRVAIVENIPAHVCSSCVEQFYDDDVSEALRRLAEAGFPNEQATREIVVPVFSLEGRLVKRSALPDDTYVD